MKGAAILRNQYGRLSRPTAVGLIGERELTFTFAIYCRPFVCRLSSVTFVRPTQVVQIFGNIFTALGTLAIR